MSAKPMHEPTRGAPWGIEHVLADRRPRWMIDKSRIDLDVSCEMTPDDEAALEPRFARVNEWSDRTDPLDLVTREQLLLALARLAGVYPLCVPGDCSGLGIRLGNGDGTFGEEEGTRLGQPRLQ
ncbi:MAG TPA: hypothetical protein VGG28_24140 [Kofleriaceae bacterium]